MFIVGINFFWAIYYNSIGFTGTQIGIIVAVSSLMGFVTTLPSGFMNDKIKSRDLISIALLLLAGWFVGISLIPTFPAVIFFTILGGIGSNLYASSSDSLFYKSTEKENLSKKIAIYQSLNYIMIALGIILSGVILNFNIPFQELIFAVGILFVIFAVIARILPKSITTDFKLVKYESDILQPKVLFFLFIVFLFSIHYGAENTTYGLFLQKNLGLNSQMSGLYMGLSILSMGATAIIFSRMIKRIKVKFLLFIGLILSGIGHILMTVQDPVLSFIFRALHETGDAAFFVFLAYGITSIFDLKRMGGNTGIVAFVSIIGSTISSFIFGVIGEKYGYNVPLVGTGVVLLTGLLIALIFNRLIIK
jgi:MFS family permease